MGRVLDIGGKSEGSIPLSEFGDELPEAGQTYEVYYDGLGDDDTAQLSKRRADRLAVDSIRAFKGVLGGNDVGLFVSSGGFTSDAQEFARGEGSKIMLLDLKRLFDLWVEHYDRIAERYRRLLPLRPVYFLAPDDN